ncbi:hypothetical protein [Chromohalobacter sp. 48-RD10]|uniref:hypothetical protein n=1 Tax=Chromohalobacter sp. 48-RD10 TaxID=2994063 RepID=UPI0024696AE3|nr:hypothetical protein [Chromohalobacter sp. 48-RD10]
MVNIVTKAFRNPKKAIRVVRYKGASVIGDNRYRKFIVLTRSRTGSNLLVSLLNSHPNISADGEIFSKLNGRDYKRIISNAFSRQPRYIKAKGFKIFYYHPQDDPLCQPSCPDGDFA